MSRQSTAAQRNLSLTEELERLEQSITLTLQGTEPPFLLVESRDELLTLHSRQLIDVCQRNRPQLQPCPPHSDNQHPSDC